jgi:LacI family transcriptional regulator
VERAEQAGATCDVLEVPRKSGLWANWQKRTGLLVRWLKHLRPPVGLLAVQDYRARAVIEECDRLGLRIPHDVAVIGMENDPTLCEFCRPTLSSVSRNAWQMGMESAAMLDRLLHNLVTACGFSSLERMRFAFKRLTGMTPLEYRQAERAKTT